MLGTGLQFGRIRVEDRFYIPVKARKNQRQPSGGSTADDGFQSSSSSANKKTAGSVNGKSSEATISMDKPSVVSHSNLDRFLESTTPSVPAQYLSKTTMGGLRTGDAEFPPYFMLADLWECFKEWSAYGAGVPFLLDGRDCVVQYYVPYLSGIQLYGPTTDSNAKPRFIGDDSDGDSYRDSSSDGSSDYEIHKGVKFSRKIENRLSELSMSDEHSSEQEGFSSDDGESGHSRGSLLFEFLERERPYCREPLADKIKDLAQRFPALKTLRSCDLLPLSWISVAWYPIYRIPTGPTLKDLDACFLTYHSLSTPMGGGGGGGAQSPVMVYPPTSEVESFPKIRLPVSGMATYKFKGSMWMHNGVSEHQMANSLMQAADNWLRLLGVHHPDFQFFASHGMYSR